MERLMNLGSTEQYNYTALKREYESISELPEPTWSASAVALARKRFGITEDYSIRDWLVAIVDHITKHYDSRERAHIKSRYYRLLCERKFLPTSAALYNSTRGKGSLSGCIVIPLSADLETIIRKTYAEVLSMLRNGIGVGLDLSVLPPRLSADSTCDRANPGPVEVLVSLVQSAEGIMRYSGLKRAAFMGALHLSHPDIFEFIHLKLAKRLSGVNISVSLDKDEKSAVQNGTMLRCGWRDQNGMIRPLSASDLAEMHRRSQCRSVEAPDLRVQGQADVVSNIAGVVGEVREGIVFLEARTIMRCIARAAHQCGDPGLINLDAINRANPTYCVDSSRRLGEGIIEVTTPCGEQPLLPYEVCHLGSINVRAFMSPRSVIDFKKLREAVPVCVQMMDDIVEWSDSGLQQATDVAQANRKIGIGIMGLADALAEAEIPYDSEQGRHFARDVMQCIHESAIQTSSVLARDRGAFLNWGTSRRAATLSVPTRHATLTTIAPTGHISTLAGCSSGIEPYFAIEYVRNAAGFHIESCDVLTRKLSKLGYSLKEWIEATRKTNPDFAFSGTLSDLSDAPSKNESLNRSLRHMKQVFKTALEISPRDHLMMVRELQKYVDNGISKTINLHNSATVEHVLEIVDSALDMELKGITLYREGSLAEQALTVVESCQQCKTSAYLRPNDCGGLLCDRAIGGCGWGTCELVSDQELSKEKI